MFRSSALGLLLASSIAVGGCDKESFEERRDRLAREAEAAQAKSDAKKKAKKDRALAARRDIIGQFSQLADVHAEAEASVPPCDEDSLTARVTPLAIDRVAVDAAKSEGRPFTDVRTLQLSAAAFYTLLKDPEGPGWMTAKALEALDEIADVSHWVVISLEVLESPEILDSGYKAGKTRASAFVYEKLRPVCRVDVEVESAQATIVAAGARNDFRDHESQVRDTNYKLKLALFGRTRAAIAKSLRESTGGKVAGLAPFAARVGGVPR